MDATIAWIDVETNGKDARSGEQLLQIAVIVTDKDFNELGEVESKFYFSREDTEALYAHADDYVKNMHTVTGLWDQLSEPANPAREEFDEFLLAWLKQFSPEPGVLKFGGNSIFLDKEFMREFLPKSYEHLSYQTVDMTSVETFLVDTDGRERYSKKFTHNALDDIRESLEQARYHRNLSKPPF
jgi:oligoribonuclease